MGDEISAILDRVYGAPKRDDVTAALDAVYGRPKYTPRDVYSLSRLTNTEPVIQPPADFGAPVDPEIAQRILHAAPASRIAPPAGYVDPNAPAPRSLAGEFATAVGRGFASAPGAIAGAVGATDAKEALNSALGVNSMQPTRDDALGRAVNIVGEFPGMLSQGPVGFAAQAASNSMERTGGNVPAALASGATAGLIGIVPVMAIAGKVPGVKDAIQKFGMGPVQEYITRVGTDAVIAGSANVLQGVATEQINRAAGAEPSPYNVAENFLAGAGTAGLIRGVGELASGKRPANVQQASVERPPIRSGPELPTLEQVDTEVGGLLKQQIAERVAAQTPKPPDLTSADGVSIYKSADEAARAASFRNERRVDGDPTLRVVPILDGAAFAVVPDTRLTDAQTRASQRDAQTYGGRYTEQQSLPKGVSDGEGQTRIGPEVQGVDQESVGQEGAQPEGAGGVDRTQEARAAGVRPVEQGQVETLPRAAGPEVTLPAGPVRDSLSQPPSAPGSDALQRSVDTGSEPGPAASAKDLSSTTSIKNEAMNADREAVGLDRLDGPERRTDISVMQEARDSGASEPEAASRLAASIIEKPRPLTDVEDAALTIHALRLKSQSRALEGEMAKLTDPSAIADKAAQMNRVQQELDQLSQATKLGGTESARGLRFRQRAMNEDMDLMAVKARFKAAKGKELSATESAMLKDKTQRLEEATRRIEELEKQSAERTAEQAVRRDSGRRRMRPEDRAIEFDTLLSRAKFLLESGCR